MQAKRITFEPDPYPFAMNTGRPSSIPRTDFGARLHAAREALGLSQAQVADKLGISQNAYACWERRPVALRPDQIGQVAGILHVSVDSLFGDDASGSRKNGPTGKARRVFEEVSKLPRKRQLRILNTVEDMLTANRLAVAR